MKISTLRDLFHSQLLSLYEEREIEAMFFIYIEDKYNIKKYRYFLNPEAEISFQITDLQSLSKGNPLQYVTEKATFCNLQLHVNPSVLIPRQETEELVTHIINKNVIESPLNFERESCKTRRGGLKILDLCTGSGAIALALAKNIDNVEIWATDISESALATARHNAHLCNVKITFLHHDILKDEISFLPDNLDIIVSNPPYIPFCEQINLHKNVVNYEPLMALFVPDKNPLVFYDAIARNAKKLLRKEGVLYFETHEKFHSELSAMLVKLDFKEITLWNDINGKPRFASCKKL